MELISLDRASLQSGIGKGRLRKMIEKGVIKGERVGTGRTAPWEIDKESLENLPEEYRAMPRTGRELVTGVVLGEGENWLSLREAALLVDRSASTVRTAVVQGRVASKRKIIKGANVIFVDRDSVMEAFPAERQRLGRRPVGSDNRVRVIEEIDRNRRYTVLEASKAKGLAISTVHRAVSEGTLKGTKVQVGPTTYRWFIEGEDLADWGIQPRAPRKYNKRSWKPVTDEVETAVELELSANGDLLTQKLLDIAAFVRDNPMVTVESCEITVRFKG